MTDTDRTRIAREVLDTLAANTGSVRIKDTDIRAWRDVHYPAPRVRATMGLEASKVEWMPCIVCISDGPNRWVYISRSDLARLAVFDATVDADGMAEEGA